MNKCDMPPNGWSCSRPKGHNGPCAARENGEGRLTVDQVMEVIKPYLRDDTPYWKEQNEKEIRSRLLKRTASQPSEPSMPVSRVKEMVDNLTDDERSELFAEYCTSCGSKNPRCQCWNDE